MKKKSSLYSILVLTCACMLLGTSFLGAQVLNKPVATGNPNLGGGSAWTAACASVDFNEYFVNFTWSPPLVNSDNEFVLELSDSNGNFGSPVELARASDKNTEFDFEFQFAVPNDVRGETYRMRVRSTSPAKTSPPSDPYPMHFVDFNSPLLISPDGNGSIPPSGTFQLCGGASVTLAPHNIPNAGTYQYNWYRSGTLLAQKSQSITVSTPGMYYVELDYGSICSGSANTLSNTIEITTGTSQGIAINGSADIGLCAGDAHTLEANISGMGLNYTWYKDGVAIAGPTSEGYTYNINTGASDFAGEYQVEVEGAGACLERSSAVTIRNLGDFEVTRQNEASIVLLPAQTRTLSVTTSATTPTFQWYKDGSPISGETSSSLEINAIGDYFARVTETSGGCTGSPIDSEITAVVSPDSFEFVIAYAGSYIACQSSDATLSLTVINAVSDTGAKTDVTSELQSSFSYQWRHNGSSLSGENSKTITVSNFENNGTYVLDGSLDSFNTSSNNLTVKLPVDETLQLTSNGTILCDGADPIVLNSSMDLSTETFEWSKDGQVIETASESITANEVGVYRLTITTHDCPLVSNEITVRAFDESLLVLDKPENLIIIEGETETVTASGAESYEWFNASNNLISSQDSFGFQEEGEYLLVANFGNCTISRVITVVFRDTFAIPNVITANGDGINDLWILPNTYSRHTDILVTIYNERGKEVFSQTNYENNWPQSTTAFNKPSMIFYYKITKAGSSLKQGTITVIR
ncbi:gliding motility-associated C-terminal domain-containing protein [Flagellimonas nanhaiensis]|uniref:Gliding motility-associated C-terminal domain-containing protein n=1 Tax=Flagellimonas nanhaiensis TaxID=2292706 RepID=A0A371JQL7_9FLAO|nr:gliding motility-associated C-terminal domain-containing protein [Allomuricauda nanhaiensis]RDY59804.1 gliding motility-associated C-terminal domain-containing protein [Allomuricauda nanhaiensis]